MPISHEPYPYRAPTEAELMQYLIGHFNGRPARAQIANARRQLREWPAHARVVYSALYNSEAPPPITAAQIMLEQADSRRLSWTTIGDVPQGPVMPPVAPWVCSVCHTPAIGPDASAPLHMHTGEPICETCADGDDYVCLRSGDVAHIDDAPTCYVCDERSLDEDMRTIDDENVCTPCRERSYNIVHCEDDDEYHFRENVNYCDADGEWYADADNMPSDDDDERDDDEDESGPVYDYNANVLNILGSKCFCDGNESAKHLNNNSALVMGVELETDRRERNSRSEIAMALLETSFSKYGICKTDGTVSGPECVTLPADLESHRKVYQWAKWCKTLAPIARGFYGTEETGAEGCGMHVHINRRAVSPLTAGKMMVFMNAEANRAFIEMIAQRAVGQNSYCKFKSDKKLTSGRQTNDDRYEALNITQHTIEVRIFRANLSASRIMKNLEFCHALTQWAAQESAQELGAERFRAWIQANSPAYPELVKFIASRTEDK